MTRSFTRDLKSIFVKSQLERNEKDLKKKEGSRRRRGYEEKFVNEFLFILHKKYKFD